MCHTYMPEREVAVCSAYEGQQARNTCPELRIFFSLGITWYFLHVHGHVLLINVHRYVGNDGSFHIRMCREVTNQHVILSSSTE